ncbi:MAG: DUF2783 domain-containing protein [Ahrensia sp.]|nr:DUF2783 domain-containing protein [Ahrensia sp.]
MSISTLETVYERLAQAIDEAGRDRETMLLAKLTLLLAERLDDPDSVLALIDDASKDLS